MGSRSLHVGRSEQAGRRGKPCPERSYCSHSMTAHALMTSASPCLHLHSVFQIHDDAFVLKHLAQQDLGTPAAPASAMMGAAAAGTEAGAAGWMGGHATSSQQGPGMDRK